MRSDLSVRFIGWNDGGFIWVYYGVVHFWQGGMLRVPRNNFRMVEIIYWRVFWVNTMDSALAYYLVEVMWEVMWAGGFWLATRVEREIVNRRRGLREIGRLNVGRRRSIWRQRYFGGKWTMKGLGRGTQGSYLRWSDVKKKGEFTLWVICVNFGIKWSIWDGFHYYCAGVMIDVKNVEIIVYRVSLLI